MPSADLVVLDTHSWLWWADEKKPLSRAARRGVDRAATVVVPAVCLWEIAGLVDRGRIRLDRDPLSWMQRALSEARVELAPLSPKVAVAAAGLGREGFVATRRIGWCTARPECSTPPWSVRIEECRRSSRRFPPVGARHIVW